MRILFIATEASPLAKVGGLADVIGSLPKALNELGHDIRLILPAYGSIKISGSSPSLLTSFSIPLKDKEISASLLRTNLTDDIPVYLVNNENYFGTDRIYNKNDLERFLFFCLAVREILSKLDWDPQIIHCHDWHTALIPMYLKQAHFLCSSVFTIHNLSYQGNFSKRFMSDFGLDQIMKFWPLHISKQPLNFMSQGILWADMVTTVSETYASEITTSKCGEGLDELLRYRGDKLVGIINGIDYDEYNPNSDPFIPANFNSSKLEMKLLNKSALQKQMRLPEDSAIPLLGIVSRLDDQKGLDVLAESLDFLFERMPRQLVVLGEGQDYYHKLFKEISNKYPCQMAVFIGFDNPLAHLIYAGCDIFLMPSIFEPCGLGQLIAMRYGAVPVVHHTGGLADTVQDLTPDLNDGNGFVFQPNDAMSILDAIQRAVDAYNGNKKDWKKIMQRIMEIDFSWQASARKYETVYNNLLKMRSEDKN